MLLLVIFIPQFREQTDAAKKVFKRYGIKVYSPDFRGPDYSIELMQIRIKSDSAVALKLGFRDGDLIVSPQFNSVSEFLNYLGQAPGTRLSVSVIRKRDFVPGKDFRSTNPQQAIVFTAP